MKVCQESGILLDYSYTLKAVNGMLTEMKENPRRFKGNRVLYVHTGMHFSSSCLHSIPVLTRDHGICHAII